MNGSRRRFLRLAAGAVAMPAVSSKAWSQAYPSRPVRFIVGFPAGNAPDIIARLIGQMLSERLGQQFVIENRPGAASNIATEVALSAPPDGYTIQMIVLTNVFNADALSASQVQFHARHRAGRRHRRCALPHRGQSVAAGEDDPGIHRLCQGAPRQDHVRLRRQRQLVAHLRRDAQENGRHRPHPCSLSLELHARPAVRTRSR